MSSSPEASDLWSQVPRRTWAQRVTQFALTRIVLGVVLGGLLGGVEFLVNQHTGESQVLRAGAAVGMVLVSIAAIAFLARVVERRSPKELGLVGALQEWLVGLSSGAVLLSSVVLALVVTGAYRVGGGGSARALLAGLVVFAPHALLEELIFRVVLFKVVEEALGSVAAVVVQALIFGVVHGGNPGATLTSTVAIAVEAGTLLAVVYMYTRRVWLVWGLHFGWNFAQGALFGINVSGFSFGGGSWLHARAVGADWLTGGTFGVEVSPVAAVFCVGTAFLFWREAKQRGQVVTYRAQRDRTRRLGVTAEHLST